MYQDELRLLCRTWLLQGEKNPSLHLLAEGARLEHHQQTAKLLEEIHGLPRSVFGGAMDKESFDLIFDVFRVLRSMGDHSMGIRFSRELIKKVGTGGNRLALAKLLNWQGTNHMCMGLFEAACEYFEKSIVLFSEEGEEGFITGAMVTMNVGNSLCMNKKFPEALEAYQRAMEKIESTPPEWFENCKNDRLNPEFCKSIVFGNIGNTYNSLGESEQDPDKKADHYQNAEKALKAALGLKTETWVRVEQRLNISLNYIRTGRLEQAEALMQELDKQVSETGSYTSLHSLIGFYRVELAAARQSWSEAAQGCMETLTSSLNESEMVIEEMVTERYLRILETIIQHRQKKGSRHGLFLLEDKSKPLMEGIIGFLGHKDEYQENDHCQQVADLAVAIGQALLKAGSGREGLPANESDLKDHIDLKFLRLAGLLHDIGKLRVPWCALNFPGKPNAQERALLQSHARESEDILNLFGLDLLARVVGEHHEAVDGSGYPKGLKRLSLMGCILAVADAYLAATTKGSPLHQAKSSQVALKEIQQGAGSRYDSRIAALLPRVIRGWRK